MLEIFLKSRTESLGSRLGCPKHPASYGLVNEQDSIKLQPAQHYSFSIVDIYAYEGLEGDKANFVTFVVSFPCFPCLSSWERGYNFGSPSSLLETSSHSRTT